jgi:NRPS condensation-like uncharacterized protein
MPDTYQAPRWFPLDVAATIYPSARTRSWNYTFRIGFLLKEDVNPGLLREALGEIHKRFPSFFVSVRHGLFWYYLERMDRFDVVQKEREVPCRPIDLFSRTAPAIRVLYDRRRFCVEIPHCVSDGGGTLTMAKALLACYLRLAGKDIPRDDSLPDSSEPPRAEELRDSYREFFTKHSEKPAPDPAAWQYRPPRERNYLKIVRGTIPLEDILPAAKARGLTLTDYLMGVYLYSFYAADPAARRTAKRIKVSVAVSLRGLYHSASLRNFSLYANIGFCPRREEPFTFEDVLEAVKGELGRAKTRENMHKLLCRHTGMMKNPLVRLVPNFLKRRILRIGYAIVGESKQTSPLSNLGRAGLPESVAAHVESIECVLGGSSQKRINCMTVSDGRFLYVAFSGDTKKTDVQREFFRLLVREGMRVHAESNIREEEEDDV